MSENEEDILVQMSLDDREFLKGLSQAVGKTDEAGKKMSGAMAKFATAAKAAGVAVAGAAAAFTALAIRQAHVGDELGKISDKFGVSTRAISSLDYAAGLAGVSTQALAGSFRFMQRSLVEASEGSEVQAAAFEKLGLKASDLIKMKPDEAFKLIADRLSQVENPAQKAAIAMDIFGRAGADIIPLIKDGAAGLAAMQEEADRFGLTISRVDAGALEAANDSVAKIGAAANGAARQFAVGLAPAISTTLERIMKGVDVADGFRKAGSAIGEAFIVAFEVIGQAVQKAMIMFDKLKLKILEATKAFREWAGMDTAVVDANMGFLKTQINRDETNLQLAENNKGTGLYASYMREVERLEKENTREKVGLGNWSKNTSTALDETTTAATKLARATESIGKAGEKAGTAAAKGFDKLGNAIGGAGEKTEDFETKLQGLTTNALSSFFSKITSNSSILSAISGDLANLAAPIVETIFGGFRAGGGPVMGNGLYMVGENGPELLRIGSKQGHVTSNKDAFGGGNAGGNFQVNVFNQSGADVQTKPSQNGQGIDIFIKKAVTGMVARGDLDSSMRGRYGLTPALTGR